MSPEIRIEDLSTDECLDLLSRERFGRLAGVADGRPFIFPVNYAFSNGSLVFRTAAGTKLSGSSFGRVVFEIDGVEPDSQTGWSVVVEGVSSEINDSLDSASADLRRLELEPWAPGDKPHWIALRPDGISGRRIVRRG
jgi:nitroimidazol reductase NimA-like FMN-containing flavoprotein (pyridoxamine 5'-phosphate oxidase superfamily)